MDEHLEYNHTWRHDMEEGEDFLWRLAMVILVSASCLGGCSRFYSNVCNIDRSYTQPLIIEPETDRLDNLIPSNSPKADKETCSICIEPMIDGDELLQLRCDHLFHKQCIVSWLQKSLNCPMCRTPL